MGVCVSQEVTPECKHSRKLDKQAAREEKEKMSVLNFLFLGAGESGKSTLFKQLNHIWGQGYSDEDRAKFLTVLFNNTVNSMKTLIDECQKRGGDCTIPMDLSKEVDLVLALPADSTVTPDIADAISRLWKCEGVQHVYSLRSHFQLPDAAEYYFNRAPEYAQDGFIPTYDDVLRIRVRTTGIAETSFKIEDNTFKVFDVGGQRNERRKWVHCFEDVTAVIFVASLSEYDQMLYEDETVPRMTEALNLFGEIANSRWFKNTAMLLFLNKSDLFREKIQHTPISCYFDDYAGDPHSFSMSSRHIQTHFEARNRQNTREIYTHVTCATDEKNVEKVFTAAKDIVIKASLRKGGLL